MMRRIDGSYISHKTCLSIRRVLFGRQVNKLKSFADSKYKAENQRLTQLNIDLDTSITERDERLVALANQHEALQCEMRQLTSEVRQQRFDTSLRRRLDSSMCGIMGKKCNDYRSKSVIL